MEALRNQHEYEHKKNKTGKFFICVSHNNNLKQKKIFNAHITYYIDCISKIGIACTDAICLRTFNTIKEQ